VQRVCEAHGHTIHLLVTDLIMPRMSGRELAERLALSRPTSKVLYVSGYAENTFVSHGTLDPSTAYLQKPVTPESLANKVRDVLDEEPV
jgi:two-component system, cell cycle sensor histidine kinase and response regulator CckA